MRERQVPVVGNTTVRGVPPSLHTVGTKRQNSLFAQFASPVQTVPPPVPAEPPFDAPPLPAVPLSMPAEPPFGVPALPAVPLPPAEVPPDDVLPPLDEVPLQPTSSDTLKTRLALPRYVMGMAPPTQGAYQ